MSGTTKVKLSKSPSKEEKKRLKKLKKDKKRCRPTQDSSTKTDNHGHPKPSEDHKRVKREENEKKAVSFFLGNNLNSSVKQLPIKHNPSDESFQLRVQVSEYSPSSDPIVVSFPAGLPSSMTATASAAPSARSNHVEDDDDNNESSKPPVFTWTKSRKTSSHGRIIHGYDDTCTYISSNEGKGHDCRLTKLYVGLYHKPTSTLKLMPASEKGTVFALDQSVTNYNDARSLDFRNYSVAERRRMVFESFGSQKKKKVMRSQQANVVEMKSVVGAGEGMMKALGKQIDENQMSESNLKVMEQLKNHKDNGGEGKMMTAVERAYAEARRSFLPPFDESAMTAYKVYDAEEVAGEEAWGQISRTLDACLHKGDEWKEALQGKRKWSMSTKELLHSVLDVKKKHAKYRIKTIILVNHLIQFHNRASKKFISGSNEEIVKILGLPQEVTAQFLTLFYVPSVERGRAGFATSKQLKDRRVVYTLIMYLMAHGKDMKIGSINNICDDLALETRDAMSFYKEAGCTCTKSKEGIVSVRLKAPLVFPPPKRGKKT